MSDFGYFIVCEDYETTQRILVLSYCDTKLLQQAQVSKPVLVSVTSLFLKDKAGRLSGCRS